MVSAAAVVLCLLMDDGLRFGVLEKTREERKKKRLRNKLRRVDAALGFGNRSGHHAARDGIPCFNHPKSQNATAFRRARLAAGQVETSSRRCVKIKRSLRWLRWRPGGPLRSVCANAWATAALRADPSDHLLRLWTLVIVPCAAFNSDPVRHISRVPLHGGFFSGRLHRIVKMTSERQAIGDSLPCRTNWRSVPLSSLRR